MHRRCPNSPAGSEWKTSDVKSELDLKKKLKEKKKKRPLRHRRQWSTLKKDCHQNINWYSAKKEWKLT